MVWSSNALFWFQLCLIQISAFQLGSNLKWYRSSSTLFSALTNQSKMNANERRIAHYIDPEKAKQRPNASMETSTFWYADVERAAVDENDVLPVQQNIDQDGPLPFGSYRTLVKSEFNPKRICVLSVGLNFWNNPASSTSIPDVDSVLATKNIQKLIDSGFNTFRPQVPKRVTKSMKISDCMKSAEHIWIEKSIFGSLVRDTPKSVVDELYLGSCIRVPLFQDNTSFCLSKVRQMIGDSILNIYGEANGCLDQVEVEFTMGQSKHGSMSPYTFDVFDVLHDMQREGLIRSIGTKGFGTNDLKVIKNAGFSPDSNEIACNLLNPSNYANHLGDETKLILSSPLAGGLLTNKFYSISNRLRDKNGSPSLTYMSVSESEQYRTSLNQIWRLNYENKNGVKISKKDTWRLVEKTLIHTMYNIAAKHSVDIASVAVRWSMQMNNLGSVAVGSSLGALDWIDVPFRRHHDLRKAFTFQLDEEDMGKLLDVAGGSLVPPTDIEGNNQEQIDFNNKKLWL